MKQDKSANFVQTLSGSSSGGSVEVKVNPSASSTQVIEASADSDSLKGTSVAFPPGSLAIAMTVKVEEAAPIIASSALTDLGYSDSSSVAAASNAVLITSSEKSDVVKPFSLSIPLSSSASLHLASKSVSILYRIFSYAENRYIVGLIPTSKVALASDKAQFEAPNFGSFQAVYLEVTEVKTATSSAPILSKNEVATLPEFAVRGLTFKADTASRKFLISFEVVGQNILKGCKVIGDRDQVPPFEKEEQIGTATSTTIPVQGSEEVAAFAKVECIDTNGRLAQAGWSEKATMPALPAAATPTAVPSTPTPTPTALPKPGSFSITSPAPYTSIASNNVPISWTSAAGAQDYTVKIGGNSDCSVSNLYSASVSSTSHTFSGVNDGGWYICIKANNNAGYTVASNSGRSITVNSGYAIQILSLPNNNAMNSPTAVSFKVTRPDSTTATEWTQSAQLSAHSDGSCSSGLYGGAVLGSPTYPTLSVPVSAGVFSVSDLLFNQRGMIYLKVQSGGLSLCTSAIQFKTMGCTNYSNISEQEGHPELDFIINCRDNTNPGAPPDNLGYSIAENDICATGWHLCYPQEYSDIMRWAKSNGKYITTNSNVFLADRPGGGYVYFWNGASQSCTQQVGGEHIRAAAESNDYWFAYNYAGCADGSYNPSESSLIYTGSDPYPGVSNAFYRNSQGMRYMTGISTAANGGSCCRNENPFFGCATKSISECSSAYGKACQWNSGTTQCEPKF